MANEYTERQMLDLLHKRYSQTNPGNGPRWAVAEHVRSAAGFDARRTIDFVAVDCWPSGGIEIHCHEIKCSRSDWLNELKQPEKAEAFVRYSDRFWLVVPDANIVKPGELPSNWGLLVASKVKHGPKWPQRGPATLHGTVRSKVPAPMLHPDPLPKEILATMMRSTAKTAKRSVKDLESQISQLRKELRTHRLEDGKLPEYALLKDNKIIDCVTTRKPLAELRSLYPYIEVKPIDDVPLNVCEQYQYWNERP